MRRSLTTLGVLLTLAASLSACSQSSQQVSETTTDSLLSSNPIEQPAGDISPQTDYQAPPEPQAAPPAASPPRPAATKPRPRPRPAPPPAAQKPVERGTLVAAGTPINIAVTAQISSETAQPGDAWSGEVKEAVIVDGVVIIPAGSTVSGVVVVAEPAKKGSRASLDLGVRSVTVNGATHSLDAGTEAIIAGSTRARNLGAIAGGAAAGALLGKAIGGSSKGAVIGGIVGGAAAGGAVAGSKGYQVVIKDGTVITFNVSKDVRIRA